MAEHLESILEVCKLEEDLNIYEEKLGIIPIWSSVFLKMREKYTDIHGNFPPLLSHSHFNLKNCILTSWKSFRQFLRLLFTNYEIENIFFGFPRLESIDGEYVDKFCDGIIKRPEISNSFLYLERGRSFKHFSPRDITNIFWVEFIDNFAITLGFALLPMLYVLKNRRYKSTFKKASNIIPITRSEKKLILRKSISDNIKLKIYAYIFKKHKVKRIFAPALKNLASVIGIAKYLNIPCFELQHGKTEGPSRLYSGIYMETFSPTAFLAFGNSSMQPFFNVPIHKMYNIGFAFKELLQSKGYSVKKDHYLFVSDPEITQEIIDSACELKNLYPHYEFSIRFHPLEVPSSKQKQQISEGKINIASNKENSTLAILKYEGIIGETTSVLYESLAFNKKTAKLAYNGLNRNMNAGKEKAKGFFVLSKPQDFEAFLSFTTQKDNSLEFYSEFNDKEFNKILRIKHFKESNDTSDNSNN